MSQIADTYSDCLLRYVAVVRDGFTTDHAAHTVSLAFPELWTDMAELAELRAHLVTDGRKMIADDIYRDGWNDHGEWCCKACGLQIGKNLLGDRPYALARKHAENCH